MTGEIKGMMETNFWGDLVIFLILNPSWDPNMTWFTYDLKNLVLEDFFLKMCIFGSVWWNSWASFKAKSRDCARPPA